MLLLVSVLAAVALWVRFSARQQWKRQPDLKLSLGIVDYTVPFDNYREHGGSMWLLNQLKVPVPNEASQWEPARSYIGYDPHNRDAPRRLAELPREGYDVIYVAETYGVYRAISRALPITRQHMDHSEVVFGGLSVADADALADFIRRISAAGAVAAAGTASVAPLVRALASPANATSNGRRFVLLFLPGGWDPLCAFAPKFGQNTIDMEPEAAAWNFMDFDLVDHPGRPNVRTFFERWGANTAVINGSNVRSVAHIVCTNLIMTSSADGSIPDGGPASQSAHPRFRFRSWFSQGRRFLANTAASSRPSDRTVSCHC